MKAAHSGLLWPGDPNDLLERRRAEAIVARVRGIAVVFALLTVAWIPVDAATLPEAHWQPLAQARLVTALALALLAYACGDHSPRLADAWRRLGLLFALATVFFFTGVALLNDLPVEAAPQGVMAAYAFVPFVLAAGIGAFPLAALECAALLALPVAAQAWATHSALSPLLEWDVLHSSWLLLVLGGVGTFAAMSQMKLVAQLVGNAIRDPLTGCLRRESGAELLDLHFRIAARHGEPFAVLFADLDRFKRVNDEFGHEAGDRVLQAAAQGLRAVLRDSDTLLRWGGEEFVVLLPRTSGDQAVRLIERLREHGIGRAPDGATVTLSIGVAERIADQVVDPIALVDLADRRMYLAKQAGRNRYVVDEAAPVVTLPLAMP